MYGVRSDRSSDSWPKRTTARMYYRLMCRLVGKEIPFDAATSGWSRAGWSTR